MDSTWLRGAESPSSYAIAPVENSELMVWKFRTKLPKAKVSGRINLEGNES